MRSRGSGRILRHISFGETGVTLRLDVPGIDPEQLEVSVDRGVLTISGKREEERTENDEFFVRERMMGTLTAACGCRRA